MTVHAGTGAIPSGPDIKMLKNSIRFKTGNVRIISNDTDDPTVVAKNGEIGTLYIQKGTGALYQKQDTGLSTNWLNLIIGPVGNGTDNRLVRWDGTGTPTIQDSLAVLDDLGALSGLTQLDVDNIQINGNTIASTDANGNINLDPNGTGFVYINSDLQVNGTYTTVTSTTMDVTNATISTNVGGNQATADGNNAGLIVTMTDATDANLHYDSTLASRFAIGDTGSEKEVVTVSDAQSITNKLLLGVDNLQLDANTISSTDVNGNIILQPNGTGSVNIPYPTANQPAFIDASNNLISKKIDLTADVSGILPIANGGTGSSAVLNGGRVMRSNLTGTLLEESPALTDGQIFVGATGGLAVPANIQPTANQTSVTNGAGTIQVGTVQDIATTSSPSFANMNLSGDLIFTGASGFVGINTVDGTDNKEVIYGAADGGGPNRSGVIRLSGNEHTNTGDVLIAQGDNIAANIDFTHGAALTLGGRMDANGKWTLGDSGGTQTHDVNGSLAVTTDITAGGNISATGSVSATTDITTGNLKLQGNTLSSTNVGGDILLQPFDSNGVVQIAQNPLEFTNLAAQPTAPAVGFDQVYFRNGRLYSQNSDGVELPVDEPVERTQLVNAGFEEGFTGSEALGWTNTNGTLSLIADSKMGGSKALNVALTAQVWDLSQGFNCNDYDKSTVGFTAWVKSDVLGPEVCSFSGANEIECKAITEVNKWQRVQVIMPAKTGENCTIKMRSTSAITGNVTIADVEFSSSPLKLKDGSLDTEWTAFTPSFVGVGVVSNVKFFWRRIGQEIVIRGNFTSGTVDASVITISLPSGIKTPLLGDMTGSVETVGQFYRGSAWIDGDPLVVIDPDSSVVKLSVSGIVNAYTGFLTGSDIGSGQLFNLNARFPVQGWKAKSEQILTASDIVSSETMNFQFKATAITDSDPIGTYNTYQGTSGAFTICATAPTISPSNNDGLAIQGRASTTTLNCPSPSIYDVKIGKNIKGITKLLYENTNRVGELNDKYNVGVSSFAGSSSFVEGVRYFYNEKTGVVRFIATSASANVYYYRRKDDTVTASDPLGYLHFHASKNPVVNATAQIPRVDYSWENEFTARIANNGTASIISQNVDFIQSVTRTSTGLVDVVFKAGFFSQVPSIKCTIGVSAGGRGEACLTTAMSTTGFSYSTGLDATYIDEDISITVSRQGSDYKSRGDAAAIIAQPTCILYPHATAETYLANSLTTDQTVPIVRNKGDCSFVSYSTNQVTLQKGTYIIEWMAGGYKSGQTIGNLYSITDSSVNTQYDYITYSDNVDNVISFNNVRDYLTIPISKVFEFRLRYTVAAANGLRSGTIKITKVK